MAWQIPLSSWIWIPSWNAQDQEDPQIVYFRKVMEFDEVPENFTVKLSADTRYKFYVNDRLVEVGPSKGDHNVWYYDEKDLTPFLQKGKNVFAAIVLRYPMSHVKGNHGMFRTETPGLYFEGSYVDSSGNTVKVIGDHSWACKKETKLAIVSENPYFAPLQILEKAEGNAEIFGWKSESFDDNDWEEAKEYSTFEVKRASSPGNLLPRTIPFMNQIDRTFEGIFCIRQSGMGKENWDRMLHGQQNIHIPAHSHEIVEINAGELTTGYLQLVMSGGQRTKVKILTSEAYVYPDEKLDSVMSLPKKGDRTDYVNGVLTGFTDEYTVGGFGSEENPEIYEPFWFRTFRFIQLEIVTGDEALNIGQFDYRETGYPLEVKSSVRTSDESLERVWEISERTLRRCMHETYEDCPFYEQLQYAMDSRSQILYTYMTSADDRLARKCMDDFRRSQRYDGLLNASYPSTMPNVIPGFSIYYIMMVYDHMMYFGDKSLVRDHFSAIDRILHYFSEQISEQGLVGKTGGLNGRDRYWSFIDWTTEWDETTGSPKAGLQGPITMESFLYVMGLQHAAKLANYVGREEVGIEYLERAANVQQAINTYAKGENGLYQDGPGVEDYSQHCQIFAILTDTVDTEEGSALLSRVLDDESYTQTSVAMAFYLFRAVEKVGLYERTQNLWDIWRGMVADNLTTCVEDHVNGRSDCHAWGSLILYELPAVVLGVKPVEPGFSKIEISPTVGYFDWAEGEVITPKGTVNVSWKRDRVTGEIELNYEAPQGTEVLVKV